MAKGMNRFSGVPLTPAALAFPMRERQWRAGELSRLTDRIREWEKQIELGKARIQELREQLKALDMVIGLHPIKIDPTTLPPVRKNAPRILPYGQLSRAIVEELQRQQRKPVTTVEIALAVAQKHELETTRKRLNELRVAVVKQLNHLLKKGLVERLHSRRTNADGWWIIAAKDQLV
jgi:hypothetical protein